jgi:hypothetical protein
MEDSGSIVDDITSQAVVFLFEIFYSMHVRSLSLMNIRSYQKVELSLSKSINLLVGIRPSKYIIKFIGLESTYVAGVLQSC